MEGFTRKLEQKMTPAVETPEIERADYLSPRLTLDEIRNTKDKEFGAFIESSGKPKTMQAVWERYASGEPTSADVGQLMALVDEFNARTEKAERLVHTITDYWDGIVGHSLDAKNIGVSFGMEKFKIITQKGLIELAYKDPKAFANIESHFKKLEDIDDKEHAMDKLVGEFCEKHHLMTDELADAMKHDDSIERARAVQLLMKHKLDGISKWKNFVDSIKNHTTQGGTRSEALAMASRRRGFVDIAESRRAFLSDAGSALAALITKDEDLRHALVTASAGETIELEKGIQSHMSFAEAQEYDLEADEFEEFASEYKTEHTAWETMSPEAHDRAFERGWARYENETFKKKPRGFWAIIAKFRLAKKKAAARDIFMKAKLKKKES